MDVSSISSPSDYNVTSYNSQNTRSSSPVNSTNINGNDKKSSDTTASTVAAIENAATGNNSLAMIDALKMIGGSGSANMAALMNVAKSAVSDTINSNIVGSIGKSGAEDNISGVIQNLSINSLNLQLNNGVKDSTDKQESASAQSDILDTLIHPETPQKNSATDQSSTEQV